MRVSALNDPSIGIDYNDGVYDRGTQPERASCAVTCHTIAVEGHEDEEIHEQAVQHAFEYCYDELLVGVVVVGQSDPVVLRAVVEGALVELLVEHGEPHDWKRREHHVVRLVDKRLVECLPAECRRKAKPEERLHEQLILIEHVVGEHCVTAVSLTSVVEQQGSQILELRDGVVTGSRGLHSLKTLDADSNVRLGNHVDVISSITDSHRDCSGCIFPNHLHNLSLLLR